MAKYTLEEIYQGDKYNIESDVFVEVIRLLQQGERSKDIREKLNMLYIKHTLITAQKMIKEGDCISDIPELQLPSLHKEEK